MRTERHSKDGVVIVIGRGCDGLILQSGELWSTGRKDGMYSQIQGTPCLQKN